MNTPDWLDEQNQARINDNSLRIVRLEEKIESLAIDVKEATVATRADIADLKNSLSIQRWLLGGAGMVVGSGLALIGKIGFNEIGAFAKFFKDMPS